MGALYIPSLPEDVGAAPAAAGVPAGGSQGQVLAKKTGTAYDTEWVTAGGLPTHLIRHGYYGWAGGVGWAFNLTGFFDSPTKTGSETYDYYGQLATAATTEAEASWLFRYLRKTPGSEIHVKFAFATITDARNWVGATLGGMNAALPYSPGYGLFSGVALRGSDVDGDTKFQVFYNGSTAATGVDLDTNPHVWKSRYEGSNNWTTQLDDDDPIEVSSPPVEGFKIATYTKADSVSKIRLWEIVVFEPVTL